MGTSNYQFRQMATAYLVSILFSLGLYAMPASASTINGPTNVCEGDIITYTYPYTLGHTYNWSVSGGTGQATVNTNTNQATFTITWGLAGNPPYTVSIQEVNGNTVINNTSLNVTVNTSPNPLISSNFDSDCVEDTVKGEGQRYVQHNPRGPSECETVCEDSPVTYTTNYVAGNSYQWTVIGSYTGISGATTNSATVTWGSPGQAFVIVTETTPAGCVQTDTTCIEIVDKPIARFKVDNGGSALYSSNDPFTAPTLEICLNSTACFDDLSLGADSWFWDFGNGNTSNQQNPCETFTNPGNYLVMQVVENNCHCKDTSYMRVKVMHEEGPEIVCQNVICNNGTFVYDAILPQPCVGGHYEWNISPNGTIVNANGTINSMTSTHVDGIDVTSIEISWGSGPIGTISLSINGCGNICDQVVSVDIPIIPNTLDIEGDDVVCIGENGHYSVPCFPGTTYKWYVNGVLQTGNDHDFSYQFNSSGTHNITVDYQNTFLSCTGMSNTFQVEVLPPFEITGPDFICEGDAANIQGPSGSTLSWEVKNQSGSIVATGTPNSSFNTPVSLTAGSYTVIAYDVSSPRDYCNDNAIHGFTIIEKPAEPTVINGPTEVCIGDLSIYTASPASSNYYLEWEVNNNGSVTTSNGNSVSIIWNGPIKEISLYHISKNNNCKSDPYNVTILDKTPPVVNITGNTPVCANTNSTTPEQYTTGALLDDYIWSINPSTAGSVVNGQGSNTIDVIWNNYSGFADVILTPVFCGANLTNDTFKVNVTNPIMTLTGPTILCQNQNGSWNATFNIGSPSNFNWEIENTSNGSIIASGSGSSFNYSFPNHSGSFVIRMTADNCNLTFTETMNVTVNPSPVANLTYTGDINCIDNNAVTLFLSVQGTGPYTYTWYHNGSTFSPTGTTNHSMGNNPSDAGSYYVVVQDGNGCTATTNTINVRNCGTPPTCTPNGGSANYSYSFGTQTPNCNVVSFFETISPAPTSIKWYFANLGTATGSNPTFSFPASGVYPVTVAGTYGPGICDNAKTIDVVVPVVSDFEINISCPGNNFDVDLINTSDVVHGPLSSFNHNWNIFDLTLGSNLTSSSSMDFLNVSGLTPGHSYEITLNVSLTYSWGGQTIPANCTHKEVFIMPEKADADFSFNYSPICVGNPIDFDDLSVGNITSWMWDFNDGSTILTSDPDKTYTSSGTYQVDLSIVDEYGCYDTYSQQVEIKNNNLSGMITVSPSTMPMCPGNTATLTFNNTTSPSSSPYDYLWVDGTIGNVKTTTQTSSHILGVTDTYGCFKSFGPEIVEVVEIPLAIIIGEDEYCVGDDIGLICNYGSNFTYTWYESINGSPYTPSGVTGTDFSYSNAPVGTHEFKVIITEPVSNCTKESLPFSVVVHPNPGPPYISTNPSPACPNNPVQLTVTNPGIFSSISWSTGDVSTSTFANSSGVYYAEGTDINGCKSYNSVNVYELPDFCEFMCGCYEDCIEPGGTYNFPGISGNYAIWKWERFDGVTWNVVSSGSGTVPDYVANTVGTHTIRLYIMTYDGCEGYSCETDLTLTTCSEPCEGDIKMDKVRCKIASDGTVYYDFNLSLNFAGIGKDCDRYTYSIIPPVGSIINSNPQYISPGYNFINGLWNTNLMYFPGGTVCFDVIITNLCDSSTCTFTVCFDVERCGDESAASRRREKSNFDQFMNDDEIQIYPNPSNGVVYIETPTHGVYLVRVFDITGKVSLEERMNFKNGTNQTLDLSSLKPGTYSIQCIGNDKLKTEKLIINR